MRELPRDLALHPNPNHMFLSAEQASLTVSPARHVTGELAGVGEVQTQAAATGGRGLEPGKNFSTTEGACRTWKQMARGTGPSLGVFQNWRVWAELFFAPEAVSAGSPRPPPAVMGEPGQRGTGKIKRGVRVCRPWSWPATLWRVKRSWEQLQEGRPHTDRAGGREGSAGEGSPSIPTVEPGPEQILAQAPP